MNASAMRQIVAAALAVAGAGLFGCGGAVEPQCSVGRASFDGSTGSHALTYTLKPGQNATQTCAQLEVGRAGLWKFYPNGFTEKGLVGLRMDLAGALVADEGARVTVNKATSLGDFAAFNPEADGFCPVPSPSMAEVVLEAPAERHAWEWSNLRIHNTESIPGTHFFADLKYTVDTCSANYGVEGIWPVIECSEDKDCDPNPDRSVGRTQGSGLNPLFPVKCHATAGICVLNGAVPQ